ncbi:MAG: GNAT family protein [Chloroflexota bacterium]|nr:GNAT family protein [Chloroflexota bacterium]
MNAFPFPDLETERLTLRQMAPADAAAVLRIFGDPKVTQYYDLEPLRSLDKALALIERQAERFELGTGIRWGIATKSAGDLIGTCGFHLFSPGYRAGIGYELAQAYWRQGFMTEALRAMFRYGFHIRELHRLEALVMPGNMPSRRLLTKLGFTNEGLLREYAFFRGAFHDLFCFSLLSHEYAGDRSWM